MTERFIYQPLKVNMKWHLQDIIVLYSGTFK